MSSLKQVETLQSYGFSIAFAESLPHNTSRRLIGQLGHLVENLYHGNAPKLAADIADVTGLKSADDAVALIRSLVEVTK